MSLRNALKGRASTGAFVSITIGFQGYFRLLKAKMTRVTHRKGPKSGKNECFTVK